MRLPLARVKQFEGNKSDFEFEENIDHIKIKQEDVHFIEPVKVKGTVENIGDRILEVRGLIRTAAQDFCYRCLTQTRVDLSIDFCFKFSDISIEPEEEEIILFSGEEIELAPYIMDEILLNWPGQILCRPDCKGICPHCGVNLNETTCNCKDKEIDPRLMALKQLLKSD